MGGDLGPSIVIPGAELAAIRHPTCRFLLFGDQAVIAPLLEQHPKLKAKAEIRHTDVSVSMTEKPSQALRRGRGKSSMWQAIDAVRTGEAQAAVSAGNTGALMAMSRFVLKTLPGISRPAIAAIWPTLRGESVVLDVGATIGADASQLVEFAIMGEAMARCLFGLDAAHRRPAEHRRRRNQGPGAGEGCGQAAARNEPAHGICGLCRRR